MVCAKCRAVMPDAARFCASCGCPAGSDALTMGASQATELSPGGFTRRTPPADGKLPSSGWLTSSDSISHGRFGPGSLLDSRYRIIGLIGRGGMGEVYRADDLRLGQPVALKLLPDAVGTDAKRLAQFHNEVRTARQVSHPNICRVYDIGEVDGHLFLSMELVDGEDLASSLRRIGRFPEDKATEIARQICAGLAAAHERGVLHRDLKPANVMLDGTGKVRITDFGLAGARSEEHTSELQSQSNLVCRLLLEKKKKQNKGRTHPDHHNICRIVHIHHYFFFNDTAPTEIYTLSLHDALPILEIARQICAGLAAAHERGVLHRDLKPANVMLDGTGKVRITDFGLAGA